MPARLTIKFTAHFGTSHSDHTGLKFLFLILINSCSHYSLKAETKEKKTYKHNEVVITEDSFTLKWLKCLDDNVNY